VRAADFMKPALEGMSKKINKLGFDIGIRAIYAAKKRPSVRIARRISVLLSDIRITMLNSFEEQTQPIRLFLQYTRRTSCDKNRMVEHYREREMFYPH